MYRVSFKDYGKSFLNRKSGSMRSFRTHPQLVGGWGEFKWVWMEYYSPIPGEYFNYVREGDETFSWNDIHGNKHRKKTCWASVDVEPFETTLGKCRSFSLWEEPDISSGLDDNLRVVVCGNGSVRWNGELISSGGFLCRRDEECWLYYWGFWGYSV